MFILYDGVEEITVTAVLCICLQDGVTPRQVSEAERQLKMMAWIDSLSGTCISGHETILLLTQLRCMCKLSVLHVVGYWTEAPVVILCFLRALLVHCTIM